MRLSQYFFGGNVYLCTMNRLFYIFAFIVALACVGCNDYCEEQEYQRNKAELMRIRKKAKQHKSIADETGIDTLVVFFEQYGTEEDEFTALFYKAWHLLYNEQYEQAYLLFRGLQDSFPKDHTELMSDIMRSIYTALQLISEKEGDIETAEKWWRISEKSGVYTKAYHYMLSQNKAWIMHEKGIDDSCKYYMDQSFEEMQETADWDDNKSFCLSEQTAHFAMLGDLDGFKCRNELLKQHPYAGENGSTDLNTGLMLLKEGKRDSAIICFKRATVSTDEVALAAYAQLAIDANNNGPKDSVFNYYQRSMERWNSMFRQKNESFTKRLEATLHNQELSTQLAQQKIKVLTLFLCFTIAILLAIVGWWLTMLTRKKLQRDLLRLETAKKEKEELEMQQQRVLDEIKSNKESDSSQELMEKVQR